MACPRSTFSAWFECVLKSFLSAGNTLYFIRIAAAYKVIYSHFDNFLLGLFKQRDDDSDTAFTAFLGLFTAF